MDLKVYYRKIRDIEEQIAAPDAVVVSNDTPDGGRAGVKTEVPLRLAAKLVVEGRARLASADEAKQHREGMQQASEEANRAAAANKIRIEVVPESGTKPRKNASRPTRES